MTMQMSIKSMRDRIQDRNLWQRSRNSGLRRLLSDQSGQVLPWVALLMVLFLGMSALAVDVGHAMVVKQQLQAAADAAALAAGANLSNSSYTTVGQTYSSGTGDKNVFTGYTITGGQATITPLCLHSVITMGVSCNAYNAVSVTETATVPMFFAGVLGIKSMVVGATSTATAKIPVPLNVAIMLDTTLSMNGTDASCGTGVTEMNCALTGVQQLLAKLNPAADHVSIFAFPNITTGTTSTNTSCTSGGNPAMLGNNPSSGIATALPYSFPPIPSDTSGYLVASGNGAATYQAVGFSSDYLSSGSLSSSSSLVKAVGGKSGCGGIQPPNYDGDYGTYYAGTIYAAQAALLSEQTSNSNSKNVLVILGDGDSDAPDAAHDNNSGNTPSSASPALPVNATQATTSASSGMYTYPSSYLLPSTNSQAASGIYPSGIGECGQAVDAANYVKTYSNSKNPTTIYTVAYGASTGSSTGLNGNCPSDVGQGQHPNITPCQVMADMASSASDFYSDYNVTGGDPGCTAPNSATSLNAIFSKIADDLTASRLIPNNTY
jgi:Flp pilus assembly protein TadG